MQWLKWLKLIFSVSEFMLAFYDMQDTTLRRPPAQTIGAKIFLLATP